MIIYKATNNITGNAKNRIKNRNENGQFIKKIQIG
jgi:hypothetical protein